MRDVTFGITTFERPLHLTNLVRSIQQYYPLARIVVADNGKRRANLPDTVSRLNLPFDCGLSRARNALIDALETKYLLILEDDFLFTSETRIEPLVDILNCDAEVGVVGGALRTIHGRVAAYALDIEVFRDTMFVREATHRLQFTPGGTPYRLCDMIWNFALFRREMLHEHRWDDRLKVGEHCPFFHQVKLAARWRVAACAEPRIFHVPVKRPLTYQKYRRRAHDLFRSYLAEQGLRNYQRILPYHFEDDSQGKPNVIVMGVGHSGTTVLTRMLHAAGWCAADADRKFAESRSIRRLNQIVERNGVLPRKQAASVLAALPRPWAIKDPRFVLTLHKWAPLMKSMDPKPILLYVRRDRQSLLSSYRRRRARGDIPQRIDQLISLSQRQYDRWPWTRLTMQYELLAAAVSCFDMDRYDAGTRRPAGDLSLPSRDEDGADLAQVAISGGAQPITERDLMGTDGSLFQIADGSIGAPEVAADGSINPLMQSEDGSWTAAEFGIDGSLHLLNLREDGSLTNLAMADDGSFNAWDFADGSWGATKSADDGSMPAHGLDFFPDGSDI